MHDFKKIWILACTEWLKWVCSLRMLILPCLAIYVYSFAVQPLMERAGDMGEPLNILEPLIALGNSSQLALVMPVIFFVLMSDFPKTDGNTILFIHRMGRIKWMLGQLLFALMSIFTYLGVIYIINTAFIMNRTFFANGWSMVVKKYSFMFPEKAHEFASYLIPENLYNQLTPFSAALQTFFLVFCYLLVLSLNLLLFNLLKMKRAGFLTSFGIIGFGTLFCSVRTNLMWLFPMANSIVWLHFTDIFKKEVLPVSLSYIYFAILIVILVLGNLMAAARVNFLSVDDLS